MASGYLIKNKEGKTLYYDPATKKARNFNIPKGATFKKASAPAKKTAPKAKPSLGKGPDSVMAKSAKPSLGKGPDSVMVKGKAPASSPKYRGGPQGDGKAPKPAKSPTYRGGSQGDGKAPVSEPKYRGGAMRDGKPSPVGGSRDPGMDKRAGRIKNAQYIAKAARSRYTPSRTWSDWWNGVVINKR